MIMIKGAKMPDGCVDCPCLNDENLMFCQITNHSLRDVDVFNERPKDCPIIELPPHGRLIDADALQKEGWVLQKQVMRMGGYAIHEMPLSCPSLPIIIEEEDGE